jgi:hypothetical protein
VSWRDEILGQFPPGEHKLTLVADPDGLLTEEFVAARLRQRNYETVNYEDPIAFRYAYEAGYRARWERGENAYLVVVIRDEVRSLDSLPYDLLRRGRQLYLGVGDLFPNLSPTVIAQLSRTDLDALHTPHTDHASSRLGPDKTADLALRHVFSVDPALIKDTADLLNLLLRRHYEGWDLPEILRDRLLRRLRAGGRFEDWPLEELVSDRTTFLSFLQERWPIFLSKLAKDEEVMVYEPSEPYGCEYPGPESLPFDDPEVQPFIGNLFLEGVLRPIPFPDNARLADSWVSVGLWTDPTAHDKRRLEGLLKTSEGSLPDPSLNHNGWLAFARRWAELIALRYKVEAPELTERFVRLRRQIDDSFHDWAITRYGGLHNLSAASPAMVHHVPRFLAREIENGQFHKVALVVVDGMALDQWVTLRDVLVEQLPDLKLSEEAVFAWVPTITPVSRQAIFAASPPAYFAASIESTDKERTLWRRFWYDSLSLGENEVAYANVAGDGDLTRIEDEVLQTKVRVAGIVVRKVDDIMHGMKLGTRGMHNQVRQWSEEGYLHRLIELLSGNGFGVYLTSDHGNVEAEGIGRISEGSIATMRGERVRVYGDPQLRTQVAQKLPNAIEWPGFGLPRDYLPLLAPGRTAFVPADRRIVGHGGIALEELLVPFVRIGREKA